MWLGSGINGASEILNYRVLHLQLSYYSSSANIGSIEIKSTSMDSCENSKEKLLFFYVANSRSNIKSIVVLMGIEQKKIGCGRA